MMLKMFLWISRRDLEQLGEVEDLEDVLRGGTPSFGIIKTAEPIDHHLPDWMHNDAEIKKFLKEQFPLASPLVPCKRKRRHKSTECSCRACQDLTTASFWAYIIRRARAGLSYPDIAREWREQFEPQATQSAVVSRIKQAMAGRIVNAKAGLRQSGQPKHGKRGRPKRVNDVNDVTKELEMVESVGC
jgi:hypothetical protein